MPLSSYAFSISVYVIGIMIAIGGIILGIGYAANEKRMKEFGKKELLESVVNGAIVGGIFLLFAPHGAITGLISQATLSGNTTLSCDAFMATNPSMCLAYDYLISPSAYTFMGETHSSVLSTASGTIAELLLLNGVLGIIAGVKLSAVVVSFQFSYVFAPIISELQYIIKMLGTVAISAVVQASVLEVAAIGSLTVLLPAGIVLRTFYPTRKLGGFLMATAIGLYVVLPMSYVLNATLVNEYSASLSPTGTSITQIMGSATSLRDSLLGSQQQLNATDSGVGFSSINSAIASISGAISGLINWLLNELAYLIVYAFVLPIFSLIITGISIREISGILGAEAHFGKFNIL